MVTFGRPLLSEWYLDPDATYLNHGTVGATPRRVLAAQWALTEQIERQPARFMLRELADEVGTGPRLRLGEAAEVVAEFVGVEAADLGFVDNATAGANAVLRSFPFGPGDELLVTDLGYGGVTNAAAYVASRTGATLRTALMPRPGAPAEAFVEAIEAALTPATRMLLVDHITAETALVLPVAEIARRCHERGVLVLADGAHGPGAIDLDVTALGVDWYFGNLHKWAMMPRSSGFLWASREQQPHLHPTVISWGYGRGMSAEFDLLGTRDPTHVLVAPVAIGMMREWGFDAMRAYDHELAWIGAQLLADRWGTTFATPESMIGTMVNVTLPDGAGSTPDDAVRMQTRLWDEERIEVPVFSHSGRLTLRLSAQVYNELGDVERLASAVLARS